MTPTTRFLLFTFGLGGLSAVLMARLMAAFQQGEAGVAVLCSLGWLSVFIGISRNARAWRKAKGWETS